MTFDQDIISKQWPKMICIVFQTVTQLFTEANNYHIRRLKTSITVIIRLTI